MEDTSLCDSLVAWQHADGVSGLVVDATASDVQLQVQHLAL
jgi:hypothetical protein